MSSVATGRIVVVGAGGLGREVLDVIEAINAAGGGLAFVGFLDDGEVDEPALSRRGASRLGASSLLASLDAGFVIGIGDGGVRRRLDTMLIAAGCRAVSIAHPAATSGGDTRVADGCIRAAGSRVTTNITLGRHVHIHVNATVGHDAVLDDYVSVYPGATVSGNVHLGSEVTVGTGANVLPGLSLGARSFVGAGAVVTKDVDPGVTVVGSPARPVSATA